MTFRTEGGTGRGFTLGPNTSTFSGVDETAAIAARDSYFASNPTDLAAYDSNQNYMIRVVYNDGASEVTRFQHRSGGAWADITPVVQGPPGEVASLSAVQIGEVPYKLPDGTFGGSNMRVLDDGSILAPPGFGVESGSVTFGDVLRLSEQAGFLGINNLLNNKQYTVVDHASPRNAASSVPTYFHLTGAETTFNAQPDDSVTITANPITKNYTVQNTARTNALTFRTASAMSNVRIKISKQSNGVAIKYLPSKQAWEEGFGGMTWAVGDNTVDFDDTPMIFNSGDVVVLEIHATSVSMKGNSAGLPYFTSTLQLGVFRDLITDNDYTATDVRNKLNGLSGAARLPITAIDGAVTSVAGRTGAVTLTYTDVAGLAAVASTGAYSSLSGLPFIPSKTSDITNDSGFITSAGAPVQSVNGYVGTVVLTKLDLGLGNVDNTSDVNKPVSTAQQAAIDLKMTQHNAAVDPHPQYTTTAEAAAAAPVQSVNSLTGAVVLNSGHLAEVGNLFYTDARVGAYLAANGYNVRNVVNVGTGVGVLRDITSGTVNLKSVTQGRGITVTSNANDVTVGSNAFPLVYNGAGAVNVPKIWFGTATVTSGVWTVNYSGAGFTTVPAITATAISTQAVAEDRCWAALTGTPTTTGCSGYGLRGALVTGSGSSVRTAPDGTVINVIAIGT